MKIAEPIKFFLKNALFSLVASSAFVGLLVGTNFGNLRTLIFQSDLRWIALLILVVFTGITFSLIRFALVLFDGAKGLVRMIESKELGR